MLPGSPPVTGQFVDDGSARAHATTKERAREAGFTKSPKLSKPASEYYARLGCSIASVERRWRNTSYNAIATLVERLSDRTRSDNIGMVTKRSR